MTCRYDREAEDYLIDGKPCRVDEYGDPTRHCTARRTCSQHVGWAELTCARCLNRTRSTLRQIVERSALMMPLALGSGVDSEAANLAGPAADYATFSARRRIDKRWIESHVPEGNQLRAMMNLLADDDELHPHSVLTRWQLMLSEDYGHPLPEHLTIGTAAAYLERNLHKVAQDEHQDFPLLSRELRKCLSHLDAVMRNSHTKDRGAPCPTCSDTNGKGPRLVREFGHWCESEDCEQIHYDTDDGDRWVCPHNREHWWSEEDYRRWVADVYEEARA